MIGKCPNCGTIITIFTKKFFSSDLASLEEIEPKCKCCKVKVNWTIPDRKLKVAKWITPFVFLSANLIVFFLSSFSFYFFIFGVIGLALYVAVNPPEIV